MNKRSTSFFLMITLLFISIVQVDAQSRRRDRNAGHDRNDAVNRSQRDRYEQRDRHADSHPYSYDSDRGSRSDGDRDEHHDNGNHYGQRGSYNRPVYHHQHDRYCSHHRGAVRHYARPRYVYYNDYDVYYDLTRNVYFTWSGRSWTMTTAVPVCLRHVNVRKAKRYAVNYYDDDFATYLDYGRPVYGDPYNW